MIYIQYFDTPFGELVLGSYQDHLCLCDWRYRKQRKTIDQRIQKGLKADFVEETSHVIEEAKIQFSPPFPSSLAETLKTLLFNELF